MLCVPTNLTVEVPMAWGASQLSAHFYTEKFLHSVVYYRVTTYPVLGRLTLYLR